jgi:hypothetical protein
VEVAAGDSPVAFCDSTSGHRVAAARGAAADAQRLAVVGDRARRDLTGSGQRAVVAGDSPPAGPVSVDGLAGGACQRRPGSLPSPSLGSSCCAAGSPAQADEAGDLSPGMFTEPVLRDTSVRRRRAGLRRRGVSLEVPVVAKRRRRRCVGEPARRGTSLCSGTTRADEHGGMARPVSLHGWASSTKADWSVDAMATQSESRRQVDGES